MGKEWPCNSDFNWELMQLSGGLRHHKSSSQEPPREVKPLLSLADGGEGQGLSCVLTNTFLARPETPFSWTWLVSRVLHSNKRLIFLRISMGSSWEVSSLPRTQRRWKWAPVCYGRGKRGIQLRVNEAPHVRSLLTLTRCRWVMLWSKRNFLWKRLLLEIRKRSGPSLSPEEFPQHWLWLTTSEQSSSILVSAKGGQDKKIQFIPWSHDLCLGMGGLRMWLAKFNIYDLLTIQGHCKERVNIFSTQMKKITWE